MQNKRTVVYINWDGFAKYYYDLASERGMVPVIDELRTQGVFFENAWCGIPAITNPMQTAISSGAYADKTGNVKIYYDKQKRMVIDQKRENNAENIADAFFRQGISVSSVHHFTFEENGTYSGDVERPFIFIPYSNYIQRFQELYNLLAGNKVHTGNEYIHVNSRPQFVALYIDDLDTIGHNNGKYAPIANSEEQRINNVLWRLHQLDTALGEMIKQLKLLGIYEDMAFFLITDHGMTPFEFNEVTHNAYVDLLSELTQMGYKYEVLKGGMTPEADTDIVICTAGLSLVVSFSKQSSEQEIIKLKDVLTKKEYVGCIMTGHELLQTGSMNFCDLYISPKPPYIFKDRAPSIGATHDSLDESSLHIFSLMWGSGIKENLIETQKVQNIDFAPAMARLLEVDPPSQCVGTCLIEVLK